MLVASGSWVPKVWLNEPILTSSPRTPHEVVVVWQSTVEVGVTLQYAVSLNWGQNFAAPASFRPVGPGVPWLCGTVLDGDPVAASSTGYPGDNWIGGLLTDETGTTNPTMAVARRPAGQTTLTDHTQVTACSNPEGNRHRGRLAIGPWWDAPHRNTPEVLAKSFTMDGASPPM